MTDLNTGNPESVQVADAPTDTEPQYAPALDTIVTAYTAGKIHKRTASSWLGDQLNASVKAQDWARASQVSAVIEQLNAAAPTKPAKAGPDADAYASAILARLDGMRLAAMAILDGTNLPGDVPAEMRDEILAKVKVAWSDPERSITPADHAEVKVYRTNVQRNVLTRNSPVDHLNAMIAGSARLASGAQFTLVPGQVYGIRELALIRSDIYPAGDCSEGALRNYFNGTAKAGVPTGWEASVTPKGSLGARWMGPTDNEADVQS